MSVVKGEFGNFEPQFVFYYAMLLLRRRLHRDRSPGLHLVAGQTGRDQHPRRGDFVTSARV
jgi:hypothetical protein